MNELLELPDDLSAWVMPPPSAQDAEPVRVFETAAEAMTFLKALREHAQRTRRKAA